VKSIRNGSNRVFKSRIPAALIAVALAGSLALDGCVDRAAQQQAKETATIVSNPVQTVAVVSPQLKTLTSNLDISGEVTTSDDTQVGAKTAGKIVAVYVRDGDKVSRGQILARQDSTPLVAQLNQAQSQVLTAQAGLATATSQLTQAIRNQQFNPYRTTASVISAKSALRAAQANLAKMLAGSRPQERSEAQATLRSAKASLDVQKKQLDRITTLVQQGAIAGSQQDTQEAAYESALATYQNAKDALELIQIGNRQEDIDAAREAVAQAQEALKTADATKSLDPLYGDQVAAARASVASAKATIQNAQDQVVIARQSLDDAVIRAPFDGQVSGKPIEVGTIATPGSEIMRIIGSGGIYFEGNVPSDQIDQIVVGMPVTVHVDAAGQNDLAARVAAISPLGSSVGRLFNVRVQFLSPPSQIKPGMFATGTVQVQTVKDAVVIPASAIISQSDQKYVFVANGQTAKKTTIKTGLQQGTEIQVFGLSTGASVIFQGQDRLTDGSKITIQKAVNMATTNHDDSRSKDIG
jgi:HlyD family secretion protein